MDVMKKSKASIPLEYILSILGGIVKDSDKTSEHVKEVAELFKGRSTEETISSSVLYTCNSVVINLWNLFGKKFEELAKANEAAAKETKTEVEEAKPQA
jgi:hypothetical protein